MTVLSAIDIVRHGRTIRELTSYIAPKTRRLLYLRISITALIAISAFVYDWSFGGLLQATIESQSLGHVTMIQCVFFGAVILVSLVQTIAPRFEDYIWRRVSTQILQRYESLYALQRSRLDVAVEDDPQLRAMVHNTSESIFRVNEFMHHGVALLRGLLSFTGAGLIVAWCSPLMFFLILGATLPELIIGMRRGKVIWSVYQREGENRRRFSDYRSYLHNSNSIRDLKLLGATSVFIEKFTRLFDDFQHKELGAALRFTWLFNVSAILSFIGIGVALGYFLQLVSMGQIEVSHFVFLFGATLRLRSSTENLFHQLASMNSDGIFVEELHNFLKLEPKIKGRVGAIALCPTSSPEIVFDNVWFRYSEQQPWILQGVSFNINSGQKIALIGDNGAGKSTLIKLLCRFYDPTVGRILVDGADLRDIDVNSWWKLLGCLFQDFERYTMTVQDLIAMGDLEHEVDILRVKSAAAQAGVESITSNLKDSWNQLIGRGYTGAVELSAGQHQRIALARLFYRSPKVMLLDEPTSWIDVPAEASIFRELHADTAQRTLIFVSHRFSTVRQADLIVVLSGGKIVEQGSHEELTAANGDYAARFQEEASYYSS